jgi:hypothetical protein
MDRAKDEVPQKTGEVVDQARVQTEQAMEKVRGSAVDMMDQQRQRAADGLGGVADALRQTGDSLRSSDQSALGQYADRAADTVEEISHQLRDKSVDELLSEAEAFARREPEVFLGGAVLLGLLASRFFKASSRRSHVRDRGFGDYGYPSEYGRTAMGTGGYDRSARGSEDIQYRSAGTGGYRTTVPTESGTGVYGSMTSGSMTAGETSGSQEYTTGRRSQPGSSNVGGEPENESWPSGEDEVFGSGTGSSRA